MVVTQLPWEDLSKMDQMPMPKNKALLPDAKERLSQLAERIHEDIRTTSHHADWIPRFSNGPVLDVLIIGAGQAGLGVAFALQRERIDQVLVVDQGDDPYRVGPWKRYARMHTLRSPKRMKGIEIDVPSLHIQRWFEACYGKDAWLHTDLVPRMDWNDYLVFYRWVTNIDVRFRTRVIAVHRPIDAEGPFEVDMCESGNEHHQHKLYARRIVFALGLIGGGGSYVPPMIASLPKEKWFHSEEELDMASLQHKRIAVLGGGASGFDNAGSALEAGAKDCVVFMRRSEVPNSNPLRWMEFPGMQEHYYDLDDASKLEFTLFNGGLPQPPTQHTIWRCFEHSNFQLRMAESWEKIEEQDHGLVIHTRTQAGDSLQYNVDVIVAATGYTVNLSLRPELKEFLDDIQLWSEAYPPSATTPAKDNPYLGSGFEFTPRDASKAPWIARLHHFSTGARTSMGVTGNQLSGIYGGLKRMAWSIATSITKENWPILMTEFRAFQHIEVTNVGPHGEHDRPYASQPQYCGECTILSN